MDNPEKKHKRRVRYKGTHPKSYKEKYKEHQPDKYADTVAKVIGKGNTSASMHISICVTEILEFLQIKPGQVGLDVTLGYGPEILTIKQLNFVKIDQLLEESGKFDFILADLGVSSMQIDNPEKGISAAERLKNMGKDQIQGMLIENADESYAKEIASAIIFAFNKGIEIITTTQLQKKLKVLYNLFQKREEKKILKNLVNVLFKHLELT